MSTQDPEPGAHVEVTDPCTGRILFTGTLAGTPAPWAGWHQVVPDRTLVSLPPGYKVRETGRHVPCHCQGPLDACCSPVHDREPS